MFKTYKYSCGDLVYSGHNSVIVIFGLAIYYVYWKILSKKVKIFYIVYLIFVLIIQATGSLIQRA